MSGFVVFKKLSLQKTIENMLGIEKWFSENPKRRVCNTDLFKVRRGFIVRDILKHSEYKAEAK